jgi:hypothetical protein
VLLCSPAAAQTFSFDLVLERPGVPNFNADPRLDGDVGTEVDFTANMVLSSAGLRGEEGVQGWSASIWHAGVDVVSLSVEGTVSATESEGGFVADEEEGVKFSGGFVVYQVVDPRENGGREGIVQAVVLAVRQPQRVLPPNTRQIIGRNRYRTLLGPEGVNAFIRYENGLKGRGQPVANAVTSNGETEHPTLDHREIAVGGGAPFEEGHCEDGLDNDRDGWTDSGDPDCPGTGSEDCADGVDNDGDQRVDCADFDCRGIRSCRESCTDGIDNDGDGNTDCDDPACLGIGRCPGLEVCGDGLDNDEDGRTDCGDTDCFGHPDCRVPEVCDDGADNDRDGRVDCDDRDCFGVGRCPAPEVCDDGLDNDRDGLTDCDDRDCSSLTACREREDCRDGIDNDIDGRIDCDDHDCAGLPPCPPREVCDNGADDDGDGLVDCADPSCEGEPPCGSAGEGFDFVLFTDGAVREASDGGGAGGIHLTNVIDVSFASEATIEATVYIVPFPGPQPDGAQGWSLSIAHNREVLRIESATIQGTDAAAAINGGFSKTEVADDPTEGGGAGDDKGADGYVSAVVLAFTLPIVLDLPQPRRPSDSTSSSRGPATLTSTPTRGSRGPRGRRWSSAPTWSSARTASWAMQVPRAGP